MMNMNCPKVSVIMPVYNGAAYLAEAIDSVLNQTYSNIEILVINDGSSDDGATERLALSYGDKIRYFAKTNGGVSSALNLGIAEMTGEYFSWLSHDDVYEKDKIEMQIRQLQAVADHNTVALCGCVFINKDSEIIAGHKAEERFSDGAKVDSKTALFNMLKNGAYNGCAFLIPKEVFDKCGGFREDLRYSQDMLMWAKIFLSGYSMVYSTCKGVKSRIHAAQQTQTKRELMHHDSLEIAKEIGPSLCENSTKKQNLLYAFAKRNAVLHNKEVVKYCAALAKDRKLFSAGEKMTLKTVELYGSVRPVIRRVYYRIFIKTKTQ